MNETTATADPTQSAGVRLTRANTLRQIGRLCFATPGLGLPAPAQVSFVDGILSLRFDTAEEALEWAAHLGADVREQTYQPDWREGPIRSVTAFAEWRGYSVQLHGWTPVDGSR